MILLLLLLTYSTTKHQMSKSNLQFAYVSQTYPVGGKIHENLSVHLRYLRILQLTLGDS